MTRLFNEPSAFADEMIDGFVAANSHRVRRVQGGVVRSTRTPENQVAVVVGGGSGHYPAFGGLVGPGLASGAAMGNLFASPSAQQVYSVATSSNRGGGVLLTYGNYAGDVLQFGQAEERLNAEGIRTVTVTVTDDISSASIDEIGKRRGIAGDLTVFKAAGAAAERGADLDEVFRIATKANERTRSFGVAFSGCRLPGADHDLFDVPEGRMAVGMGIHGEPGISETDVPTADELATLFVEKLLGEVPPSVQQVEGSRVAVILNGLGSVKYEELFVVYRKVAQLLEGAGLVVVEPEVGELVTSFDMAGASLTLFWLDDELEELWAAPADAPAYRKGSIGSVETMDSSEWLAEAAADTAVPAASTESQRSAAVAVAALEATKATIDANADELGRIDAVAGDGDHGIGMQRGVAAAVDAAIEARDLGAGAGTVLIRAADAWADRAGGTSGALWGVILRGIGTTVGDDTAPDAATVAAGVAKGAQAVVDFGKAELGDKTMVDVLLPFADALKARTGEGLPLAEAWAAASVVAIDAAEATKDLLPKMGRARPHAEKSLGTPDAGAHSLALITRAVAAVLETRNN